MNAQKAMPGLPGTCRLCGCTDDRACPGGCSWVEPGLCSACAGEPAPGPYSWQQIIKPGSDSLGHLYIQDARGRNIGCVWGPSPEKGATCALFRASWSMKQALGLARLFIAESAGCFDGPQLRAQARAVVAHIDAAVALADDHVTR